VGNGGDAMLIQQYGHSSQGRFQFLEEIFTEGLRATYGPSIPRRFRQDVANIQ